MNTTNSTNWQQVWISKTRYNPIMCYYGEDMIELNLRAPLSLPVINN